MVYTFSTIRNTILLTKLYNLLLIIFYVCICLHLPTSELTVIKGSAMVPETDKIIRRWVYPLFCIILLAGFSRPLAAFYQLSKTNSNYNFLLLIPLFSLFFFIRERRNLTIASKLTLYPGLPIAVSGFPLLIIPIFFNLRLYPLLKLDFQILSFLVLFIGGTIITYGSAIVQKFRFSWLLLLLMLPLPTRVLDLIITFFRDGSAEVVNVLMQCTGVDFIRDGLAFHLPKTSIYIAKECSGIRSSTALVITGLLAGHIYLRSFWSKTVFLLTVIPLTFIKNGIRITTLTILAEKVDPAWLTGSLHHKGGIVFFIVILSLFFLSLFSIQKFERRMLTHRSGNSTKNTTDAKSLIPIPDTGCTTSADMKNPTPPE